MQSMSFTLRNYAEKNNAQVQRFKPKKSSTKTPKKKQAAPEPVKVRTEFPETWLWIDETIRLVLFWKKCFYLYG